MDEEVKKLAADKVNAIIQKIGYPTNVRLRTRITWI
jgi:hypothetical protein